VKKVLAVLAALAFATVAYGQNTVKIGVVAFISGPAAAPFGVPAKQAADFVFEELNAGKVPGPYNKKGFGGVPLEMVMVDEAGTTTTQVTEFRNLVQKHNVDLVIGYISSGNCLAIAPVAEELKKFTNFYDCGTPRIFEDASYKYVFRTSSHATKDSVGAALYVKDLKPNLKSIAGLNQNYAWGQDSWGDFELAMKVLVPSDRGEDLADAEALRRPVQRRDLGAARRRRRRAPLELLGRRPRGADPAGRPARADAEEHDHPHCRRDRDAQDGCADSRRHGARRARSLRPVRAEKPLQRLVLERATRRSTRCRRTTSPIRWHRRSSA
jgi:hypothetical protein